MYYCCNLKIINSLLPITYLIYSRGAGLDDVEFFASHEVEEVANLAHGQILQSGLSRNRYLHHLGQLTPEKSGFGKFKPEGWKANGQAHGCGRLVIPIGHIVYRWTEELTSSTLTFAAFTTFLSPAIDRNDNLMRRSRNVRFRQVRN